MFETLEIGRADHVCTIRMNRPQALNACNQQMWQDLVAAFRWVAEQSAFRAVILVGEGRAFCVGADLKETAWKGETVAQSRRRIERNQQQLAREIVGLPVPVIAAINGYALGGGVEIALACDFRIAADSAMLGFHETGLGLFLTGAATSLLPRLVGLSQAKRLVYTAERIDAAQADRIGLVDEVVPAAELQARADALAQQIAGNAPVSVALAKSIMNRLAIGDLETALALETQALLTTYATDDHLEGPRAFAEKRKPNFVGH